MALPVAKVFRKVWDWVKVLHFCPLGVPLSRTCFDIGYDKHHQTMECLQISLLGGYMNGLSIDFISLHSLPFP